MRNALRADVCCDGTALWHLAQVFTAPCIAMREQRPAESASTPSGGASSSATEAQKASSRGATPTSILSGLTRRASGVGGSSSASAPSQRRYSNPLGQRRYSNPLGQLRRGSGSSASGDTPSRPRRGSGPEVTASPSSSRHEPPSPDKGCVESGGSRRRSGAVGTPATEPSIEALFASKPKSTTRRNTAGVPAFKVTSIQPGGPAQPPRKLQGAITDVMVGLRASDQAGGRPAGDATSSVLDLARKAHDERVAGDGMPSGERASGGAADASAGPAASARIGRVDIEASAIPPTPAAPSGPAAPSVPAAPAAPAAPAQQADAVSWPSVRSRVEPDAAGASEADRGESPEPSASHEGSSGARRSWRNGNLAAGSFRTKKCRGPGFGGGSATASSSSILADELNLASDLESELLGDVYVSEEIPPFMLMPSWLVTRAWVALIRAATIVSVIMWPLVAAQLTKPSAVGWGLLYCLDVIFVADVIRKFNTAV